MNEIKIMWTSVNEVFCSFFNTSLQDVPLSSKELLGEVGVVGLMLYEVVI